jgi:RNA polymerase sigma-70 factor, ECF subfamily
MAHPVTTPRNPVRFPGLGPSCLTAEATRERTELVGDAAAHDEELVRRCGRGDAAAFTHLISAFERVALSIAYGVTGDAGCAGDVVQDAFLRAWQRIGDLKEPAKFGPWLCGIVRNLAIDVARARALRTSRGAPEAAAADSPARCAGPLDELNHREECGRLDAALRKLDDITRSAVVLRYYEDLSSKQIGELLGIAATAVDMRLMRARRQLRQHLEQPQDVGTENNEGAL